MGSFLVGHEGTKNQRRVKGVISQAKFKKNTKQKQKHTQKHKSKEGRRWVGGGNKPKLPPPLDGVQVRGAFGGSSLGGLARDCFQGLRF